jgi:hypothetical protein
MYLAAEVESISVTNRSLRLPSLRQLNFTGGSPVKTVLEQLDLVSCLNGCSFQRLASLRFLNSTH